MSRARRLDFTGCLILAILAALLAWGLIPAGAVV
jgi:hypothetical protein